MIGSDSQMEPVSFRPVRIHLWDWPVESDPGMNPITSRPTYIPDLTSGSNEPLGEIIPVPNFEDLHRATPCPNFQKVTKIIPTRRTRINMSLKLPKSSGVFKVSPLT